MKPDRMRKKSMASEPAMKTRPARPRTGPVDGE